MLVLAFALLLTVSTVAVGGSLLSKEAKNKETRKKSDSRRVAFFVFYLALCRVCGAGGVVVIFRR